MNTFLGRQAFAIGTRTYTWEDVAIAAILRGEWSGLQGRTRRGLALVHRAEEQESLPSEEELEEAAQEFRYERDLITAEEMEAWLARLELTADQWMDHVERTLLLRNRADLPEESLAEFAPDEDEIAGCILAEAICSGALARFGETLAGRAAFVEQAAADDSTKGSTPVAVERAVAAFPEALAASGLGGLVSVRPERVADLERLELAFEGLSRRIMTPSAIRAQIESRRLDWIRLDVFDLSFAHEAAAREASLCLREDGESIEAVAANAHAPARKARLYLEDVDPASRPDLLAAGPGELVGPLCWGEDYHLLRVLVKTMPSEEDPEVRRRAEERLLGNTLEQEKQARVRWLARI